jgi:hypothetical protein
MWGKICIAVNKIIVAVTKNDCVKHDSTLNKRKNKKNEKAVLLGKIYGLKVVNGQADRFSL